jgi:hypothetical protein
MPFLYGDAVTQLALAKAWRSPAQVVKCGRAASARLATPKTTRTAPTAGRLHVVLLRMTARTSVAIHWTGSFTETTRAGRAVEWLEQLEPLVGVTSRAVDPENREHTSCRSSTPRLAS